MSKRDVTSRRYDFGKNGAGVVYEVEPVCDDAGVAAVWIPDASTGFGVEVNLPNDVLRVDRGGLVAMRDLLDVAIRALDATGGEPCRCCA